MFEAQPVRKNVCARHDHDVKPQKFRRYSQSRMDGRYCVVPFVQNPGQRRLYLLMERRPHHQSDHQQIQEQHRSLANAMRGVAFLFGKKSTCRQRHPHHELNDEVEICPEGGARPEKAFHWKESQQCETFLFVPLVPSRCI